MWSWSFSNSCVLHTIFKIVKTLKTCVTKSIIVTSTPTPISSIINGTGLEVIGYSNPCTWILTITTCTSISFMGKNKVQKEWLVFLFWSQIDFGFSMIVTTSSLQELVAIITTCISEIFWKIVSGTSTSLPVSWSYVQPSNCNQYATN